MNRSDINFRIDIVGKGPLKFELLSSIAKVSLTENIFLHGALSHVKTLELIACSDVFLMTSLHEGLPISMMEAMALAKPVVVPRIGGIPEVVNHEKNGLLFTPNNVVSERSDIVFLESSR